jgi:cyclophilin family peptidyl-prolyl cis-trans isomerase
MQALLFVGMLSMGVAGIARAQDATLPPAEPAKPPAQPEPAAPTQENKLVYYRMTTSMGDIVLELNAEKAPISTKNFGAYVDKGFYDGTVFHRVIENFMIQGGGFTPEMQQKKADPPIKNEWKNGLKNKRGTICMARTQIADSATSQFFINVKDNAFLDDPRDGAAYAVFGRVVGGMDVVDKIKDVKTGVRGGHQDVPVEPVVIKKVAKITKEEADKAGSGSSGG